MYQEQLGAIGAEIDRTITDLNEKITSGAAAAAIVAGERDYLRAEYDRVAAELFACQNPEPSYTLSLGYCPDPNTVTEVKRLSVWSGGTVRRTYKGPGPWPTSWSRGAAAGDAAAGLRSAHTMKGTSSSMLVSIERLLSGVEDEAIKAYLRGSPKDAILGFLHEPEDDFRDNGWDRRIYKRGQRKFRVLIDAVNAEDGGNRLFSGNLMSSTSDTDSMRFYPGDGVWDIFGTDGYNWPSRAPGQTVPRWREAEEIFAPDVNFAKSLGLPFAIFEFGCRKTGLYENANDPDFVQSPAEAALQVDWMTKARDFFIETAQPVVATYFHHDWWLMPQEAHEALGGRTPNG